MAIQKFKDELKTNTTRQPSTNRQETPRVETKAPRAQTPKIETPKKTEQPRINKVSKPTTVNKGKQVEKVNPVQQSYINKFAGIGWTSNEKITSRQDFNGTDDDYTNYLIDSNANLTKGPGYDWFKGMADRNGTTVMEEYDAARKKKEYKADFDESNNFQQNEDYDKQMALFTNAAGDVSKTGEEMDQWGKDISTGFESAYSKYNSIVEDLNSGKRTYDGATKIELEGLQKQLDHWKSEAESYSSFSFNGLKDFDADILANNELIKELSALAYDPNTDPDTAIQASQQIADLQKQNGELEELQKYKERYEMSVGYEWLKENGTQEEIDQYIENYSHLDDTMLERFGQKMEADFNGFIGSVAYTVGSIPGMGVAVYEGVKNTYNKILNNKGLIDDEDFESIKEASNQAISYYSKNAWTDYGLAMLELQDQMEYKMRLGATNAETMAIDAFASAIKNYVMLAGGIMMARSLLGEGIGAATGKALLAGEKYAISSGMVGEKVTTALMSMEAFAKTAQNDMKMTDENGQPLYTMDQIYAHAALSYAIEFATEQIGGERFLKRFEDSGMLKWVFADTFANVADIADNMVQQGVAESIEEAMGWVAEPLAEAITLGNVPSVESWDTNELMVAMESAFLSGCLMDSVTSARNVYDTFFNVTSGRGMTMVEAIRDKMVSMLPDMDRVNPLVDGKTEYELAVEFINRADNAIYNADNKSAVGDAVKNLTELAQIRDTLGHNIRQKAFQVLQAENYSQVQQMNDVLKMSEQALDITQDYLYQQGINADVKAFYDKSREERQNIVRINNYAKSQNVPVRFENYVYDDEGRLVDGSFNHKTQEIEISMNAKLGEVSTLIHEYTHFSQKSKLYYGSLKQSVKDIVEADRIQAQKEGREAPASYDEAWRRLVADNYLRENHDTRIFEANDALKKEAYEYVDNKATEDEWNDAEMELVAMYTQKYLGRKAKDGGVDFARRLAKYNSSFVYKFITDLQNIKSEGGTVGNVEYNLMRAINDVMQQREAERKAIIDAWSDVLKKQKSYSQGTAKTLLDAKYNLNADADLLSFAESREKALYAAKFMYRKNQEAINKGETPPFTRDEIFRKTGWYMYNVKGWQADYKDNRNWMYEFFNDKAVKKLEKVASDLKATNSDYNGTIEYIVGSDSLFAKLYPEIVKLPLKMYTFNNPDLGYGFVLPENGKAKEVHIDRAQDIEKQKESFFHELQHCVQFLEDTPHNPSDDWDIEAAAIRKPLVEDMIKKYKIINEKTLNFLAETYYNSIAHNRKDPKRDVVNSLKNLYRQFNDPALIKSDKDIAAFAATLRDVFSDENKLNEFYLDIKDFFDKADTNTQNLAWRIYANEHGEEEARMDSYRTLHAADRNKTPDVDGWVDKADAVNHTGYPKYFSSGTAVEQLNDVEVADGSASISYSRGTWEIVDQPELIKDLAKNVGVSEEKAKKWVNDVNSVAKKVADNQFLLDYEPNANASFLKSNSDYRVSVEASTLCEKRIIVNDTIEAIQKLIPNTVLTGMDYIHIRRMLADRGEKVSCGYCYVESRRKDLGKVAKEFLDQYNDPDLTIYDITTTRGVEELMKTKPEAYEAFVKHNNARGQARVALVESRTEYRGEIMKFTQRFVDTLIKEGGLRLQSYSDLEVPHIIDMMQVVVDMSRKGLTSQAYTKVPAFADIFGGSGVKINLSIIASGIDSRGRLIFDDVEGMPHEIAFKLRKKHSKNVGTVLVGETDEMILAAMADDRVDYIIPFHRSGWAKKEYEELGITGFNNYTKWQLERWVNPADHNGDRYPKKHIYPSDYWDYNLSGKENAEKYLELCKKEGKIPKFEKFLKDNGDGSWSLQPDGSTDGYWKLLIDFKMYDNNGVGAPQTTVQPIFNMRAVNKALKEYGGEHRTSQANKEVVDEFLKEKGYKSYSSGTDLDELDAEYNKAVESGDMETAQSLVDRVARENGYTVKGYHGSPNKDFTVFNGKGNSRFGKYKFGKYNVNYFTTSKDNADSFSDTDNGPVGAREFYLKLENPYTVNNAATGNRTSFNIEDADIRQYEERLFKRALRKLEDVYSVDEANEILMPFSMEVRKSEYGDYEIYRLGNNSAFGQDHYITVGGDINDMFNDTDTIDELRDAVIWEDEDKWYSTDAIIKIVLAMNETYGTTYDSVIFDDIFDSASMFGEHATDIVTLDSSNQAKSADPVTYDDDGNVIPLSQRFNSNNNDIRYSRGMDIDELSNDRTTDELYDMNGPEDEQVKEFQENIKNDANLSDKEKKELLSNYLPDGTNRLVMRDSRLDDAIERFGATNPKYSKAYIAWISPKDFLDLTTGYANRILSDIEETASKLNLTQLRAYPGDFTLWIYNETDEDGMREASIDTHEGRHRMVALRDAGIERVPVFLINFENKYNKTPTDRMYINGQIFNEDIDRGIRGHSVLNVIPVNEANRETIRKEFGVGNIYYRHGVGTVSYSSGETVDDLNDVEPNYEDEKMTIPDSDLDRYRVIREKDFNKKNHKNQNDSGGVDMRKEREDEAKAIKAFEKKRSKQLKEFKKEFGLTPSKYARFSELYDEYFYEKSEERRKTLRKEMYGLFPESPAINPATKKKQSKWKIGKSALGKYATWYKQKGNPRGIFTTKTHRQTALQGEAFVEQFHRDLENGWTALEWVTDYIDSGEIYDVRNNGVVNAGLLIGELNRMGTDDAIAARKKLYEAFKAADAYAGQLVESNKTLYDLTSPIARGLYYEHVKNGLISETEKRYGDKYTEKIEKIFDDNMDKLLNDDSSERAKREFMDAISSLSKGIRSALPKSFGQKLMSLRYWSMLSSMKTVVANKLSNLSSRGVYRLNDIVKAPIEDLMVRKGKMKESERTVKLNLNPEQSKVNRPLASEMFDKNFKENGGKWLDSEAGPKDLYVRDIAQVLRDDNDVTNARFRELADKLQEIQRTALSDHKDCKKRFMQNVDNICQARGIDLSKVVEYSDTYYAIYDEAINNAKEVVHHNSTLLNEINNFFKAAGWRDIYISEEDTRSMRKWKEAVREWKKAHPKGSRTISFIDQTFLPFVRTNASIMKKALEFNPVTGTVNSFIKYRKMMDKGSPQEFVDAVSKTLTGTALYALAFALARLGWIKWEKDDEDYSGEIAIKFPGKDKYLTVDSLDPISTMFAMGAMFYQTLKEKGGPVSEFWDEAFWNSVDIARNQQLSMFSTIFSLWDNVKQAKKGTNAYGEKYAIDDLIFNDLAYTLLSQYIPGILRDTSRLMNPNRKQTYDPQTLKYLANRIANNLPLRSNLPDQVDATGKAKTYIEPFTQLFGFNSRFLNNVLSNMLLRSHIVDENGKIVSETSGTSNLNDKQAESYTALTQKYPYTDENEDGYSDAHWLRENVPSNFYFTDGKVQLSGADKEKYGSAWTKQWTSTAKALDGNDIYKSLSETNQVDVLYKAQTMATNVQAAKYAQANGIKMTKNQWKALTLSKYYGSDSTKASLIALATATDNDNRSLFNLYDEEGNAVKNSKALKVREMYEAAGIYDEIVEFCKKNGLDYSDVGLNKSVVKMSEAKENAKYASLFDYVGSEGYSNTSKGKTTKKTTATGRKSSSKSKSLGTSSKIKTSKVNIAGGDDFFATLLKNMKKKG